MCISLRIRAFHDLVYQPVTLEACTRFLQQNFSQIRLWGLFATIKNFERIKIVCEYSAYKCKLHLWLSYVSLTIRVSVPRQQLDYHRINFR